MAQIVREQEQELWQGGILIKRYRQGVGTGEAEMECFDTPDPPYWLQDTGGGGRLVPKA